jgi:RND family efflux transporter MFP subunit
MAAKTFGSICRGASPNAVVFFFLALSGLALCGCNAKNVYAPPPPPKVTVAQPLQQTATIYLEFTGNTAAFNTVDLVARVQGFLESIDYKDGATVAKGAQLFTIQRDTYQAQLDQAQATLASNQAALVNAQANYQRQVSLSKNDFASQATLDSAKSQNDQAAAAVTSAQASLQLANINLGYTSVQAPFDGTVTNHLVDVGALVGASGPTKLATIVQTDPLYVYFNLSEPQVLRIRQGLAKQGRKITEADLAKVPVEVGLQDEEGYPHKGWLNYASPEVDPSTGTLTVRALFDNKDHALLAGLFVRVRLPVATQENALLAPDDAIGTGQEGSYLLVVGKDDVVERKVVKTGQRQGKMRIIKSGLDPSDWVVTEGLQMAAPGSKVAPEKTTLDAAATTAGATPAPNPPKGSAP